MSENTEDQPPPRNENNQTQIGPQLCFGGGERMYFPLTNPQIGNQMIPMTILPSPFRTERIIFIPNGMDIVGALSDISMNYRQEIYILGGSGFVSDATFTILPSRLQVTCVGRTEILYLSGWFQPMTQTARDFIIPSSRVNGILHVTLSDVCYLGSHPGVVIPTTLIASGFVEVYVTFVCGPGSVVQPDAPEGPMQSILIRAQPQAPVEE